MNKARRGDVVASEADVYGVGSLTATLAKHREPYMQLKNRATESRSPDILKKTARGQTRYDAWRSSFIV